MEEAVAGVRCAGRGAGRIRSRLPGRSRRGQKGETELFPFVPQGVFLLGGQKMLLFLAQHTHTVPTGVLQIR